MAESECFRNSPVVVFACHCRHKRGSNRSRDPTRRFLWPGLRNHPPRRVELLRCLFAAWKRARDRGTKPCFDWGLGGGGVCVRKWKGVKKHEGDFQGFLGAWRSFVRCKMWFMVKIFSEIRGEILLLFLNYALNYTSYLDWN